MFVVERVETFDVSGPGARKQRPARAGCLIVLAILLAAPCGGQQAAPEVRIETFAPVRAWAVGTEAIALAATVRNAGNAALPAGTVSARIYSLTGLDYTGGDTAPKLPALAAGATASFEWRLQPTTPDGPLVAALTVESPGSLPIVRVLPIPHLAAAPPPDPAYSVKSAMARTSGTQSVVENDRVRVRVLEDTGGGPVILLSAHAGGGWRQAGAVAPPIRALTAEGGQRPWWQSFKVDSVKAENGKSEAVLEVAGRMGLWWRATLSLAVRNGSSVVDVRLRLSPTRRMRLFGLQLCRFLAGEGSFGATSSEDPVDDTSGPNAVGAVRWGELTVGVVAQGQAPFAGWQAAPLEPARGADYRVMGAGWNAPTTPALVEPGAMVELRARLFAIAPSHSVRDAFRVSLPLPAVPPAR